MTLVDFVAPRVATGRAPTSQRDVLAIAQAGITHVVGCRARRDDSDRFVGHAPAIAYLWAPVDDDGEPKPASWFETVVRFAADALADPSAKVLLYCSLGINRGPSAAYAVLRAVLEMTPADALAAVRRARPTADLAYAPDADRWLASRAAVRDPQACPLCEAAPITPRVYDDETSWVADCSTCGTPMVVWRHHGTSPPAEDVASMVGELRAAGLARFGPGRYAIDFRRRSIPGHWHAHARPARAPDRRAEVVAQAVEDGYVGFRCFALDRTPAGPVLASPMAPRRADVSGWRNRGAAGPTAEPWLESTVVAQCKMPRACATPPGPRCECGLYVWASLRGTVHFLGIPAVAVVHLDGQRHEWNEPTRMGGRRVGNFPALRAERVTIVCLLVDAEGAAHRAQLEGRYAVRVEQFTSSPAPRRRALDFLDALLELGVETAESHQLRRRLASLLRQHGEVDARLGWPRIGWQGWLLEEHPDEGVAVADKVAARWGRGRPALTDAEIG